MIGRDFKKWYRLPERLQLTYSLIFSVVVLSGFSFIWKFYQELPIKKVAGASTTNVALGTTAKISNYVGNGFSKLLADPITLAIYIGIPFLITAVSFLLWQIRKSIKGPAKEREINNNDDELI